MKKEHEHKHDHEHSHGCDGCGCCEHEHEHSSGTLETVITAAGAVLVGLSFLPMITGTVKTILLVAATVICGVPVLLDAIAALREKEISEAFLLVVAVVAACILGEFFEAAMVSVLFRIGELMEEFASDRSRKSIEAVFGIVSETANRVLPDGTTEKISADDIKKGMLLAVMPHETVPADGKVTKGAGTMDASALTGESVPISVCEGSVVLSGMQNGDTVIYFEATAEKAESSAARIVEMVEEAYQKKGKAQRAVAKFARVYTPAIVAAAVLIAVVPSVITGDWREWISRSLILLVASCPCAIVISAPLAFFSTMGAAAKNGMIIKGSRYIEALAKADTVLLDKTGTLTTGELKVDKVYTADGFTRDDVLSLAARCEKYSTHPIARAIVSEAGKIEAEEATEISETAGEGAAVTLSCGRVLCGGERLMKSNGVDISDMPVSPVYVALNGKPVGAVSVIGEVRPEAPEVIKKLRRLGVRHSVMLTGDTAEQARRVCGVCDIDDFKSGLLPEEKLTNLEDIRDGSSGVIYVGDGINDAPVLACADVGVAMGLGTQAACEAADVILTDSDLSRLADTVYQSKRAMRVLRSNIAFAVTVKIVVVALGVAGIAPMTAAIFADVGTMIISVINSAKLLKVKRYQ